MEAASISWSTAKQHRLRDRLVGFWAQDEWDIALCPLAQRVSRPVLHRKINFTCSSPTLNMELKYACWRKLERAEWSPTYGTLPQSIHRLVEWLNHITPTVSSFLQNSFTWWELSLRSYLMEHGESVPRTVTKLDGSQRLHAYQAENPSVGVLRSIYHTLQEAYEEKGEDEKDVWDVRQLGIPFNQSRSGYKLNFTRLMQPWLRQAAKRYIRYNLTIHSVADCQNKLKALNIFSAFVLRRAPTLQPSDVDRTLIIDFLSYLSSSGSTEETRKKHLLSLRTFFEVCAREGWSALPEKRLIYEEDFPHPQKALPRFIPQEVLDQLNQHVDALPPHVMRMVLILQECGMRISELCTMAFECLTQDAAGDWFLCSFQGKMKKEHRIPISREVVAVIQEQQKVVRNQWGPDMPLLFPTTRGLPFKQGTFLDALNRLAYHKQIREAAGKVYRFQSHQFRHTVGTRMINSGVPQHIVQRYLGHESPEMTARYAHMPDQTMKEEYMKFRGRVVDVTGKVIEQSGEVNGGDAQWIKKNILAQALSNGKCALPVVAGDCPHANACLTCVHFRTDASFLPQHQAQLQETQRLIQVARSNGWKRQAEMNEKVEANLKRIITALEGNSHDA